jgi:class 3 adenylate cyclase/tetratricopeptide (TPR) repeat protein
VPTCVSCGRENPDDACFCNACGAALTEVPAAREQRKTVTVLFCDVSDSTALGERLDPEPLRALLAHYFERMKAIVERHGGAVEKFIGDAVMAVFGVPVLHEDDALRAVRAAVEMRDAFAELGVEGRIGITTGEVVTGTEERLATGDAVNVAARLEQAAQPGEILIGEETLRLTRDAVEVEEVEPLQLKGKSEPVVAHRLVSMGGAEGFSRRLDAPMIGREREQRLLASVWERVVSESACQLFTILGPAGVGKSRLAAEFLASLGDAVVVHGRCLPYGEGITYWPVVEVVKQLPATEVDPVADETLRVLVGDAQIVTSSEEIAWAFRKLLEAFASQQPLVCVLDDLHWGEETYLDLVEHVADLSRDAPILLLCVARPELLDRRSGWGGGKVNATTVLLEPLAPEETERLIDSLAQVDDALRLRIREAAEGNPLFVEEMVAMLHESPNGDVAVPPTIQALLAARLDQLDPSDRDVLQCGSVEGRVFHRGAVQALAPEESQVTTRLSALVRKELVRPDKPQLPGEDAFRFRHLLIRDAAYNALPKATRAELHERFAHWLGEHGSTLAELDEILGYHLEQAYRYRTELGALDDHARELGTAASRRLAASGERALARGDMSAAAGLLERATTLLEPDEEARLRLLPQLAYALLQAGQLTRAEAVLAEASEAARRAGDRGLEASVVVYQVRLRITADPQTPFAAAQAPLRAAAETFEELGDEAGLARASRMLALLDFWQGRAEEAAGALERAAEHARRADDRRLELDCLEWIPTCLLFGPVPADAAIHRSEELIERAAGDRRFEAWSREKLCVFEAMLGHFDKARQLREQARGALEGLGMRLELAGAAHDFGRVELLAGDPAAAEREFRAGYELSERMGETGYLSTTAGLLAQALYAQGRYEEALRYTKEGERAAAADDVVSQFLWRAVRATVLARRGELEPAEKLAREAVTLADSTDDLDRRGTVHLALAEVLQLAGRESEASAEAQESLRLYEAKGNVVSVGRVRAMLAGLHEASATS